VDGKRAAKRSSKRAEGPVDTLKREGTAKERGKRAEERGKRAEERGRTAEERGKTAEGKETPREVTPLREHAETERYGNPQHNSNIKSIRELSRDSLIPVLGKAGAKPPSEIMKQKRPSLAALSTANEVPPSSAPVAAPRCKTSEPSRIVPGGGVPSGGVPLSVQRDEARRKQMIEEQAAEDDILKDNKGKDAAQKRAVDPQTRLHMDKREFCAPPCTAPPCTAPLTLPLRHLCCCKYLLHVSALT
jgi:hypothetical protein